MPFLKYNFKSKVIIAIIAFMMTSAQVPSGKEYQIKAVFLFNFVQFVEWPSTAFAGPDAPFTIGVLGKDPFGNYLDAIIQNEKVGGHPILVKRYSSIETVETCHILFISDSEKEDQANVLQKLATKNVLSVGDNEDFIKEGGIIRFKTVEGKIRMQVNIKSAQAADLKISSKLLRLAEVVN